MGKISIRAEANGWNDSIFLVPVDLAQPMGDDYDFLDQYGTVTLRHIRAHAETYVNTPTRAAQDSIQLGIAIMASVTVAGFNKISIRKSEYTVGRRIVGVALLKVLIGVSQVDTNATVSFI